MEELKAEEHCWVVHLQTKGRDQVYAAVPLPLAPLPPADVAALLLVAAHASANLIWQL